MIIFFCLVLLLAIVVLGLAVQRWLFKEFGVRHDSEWELYQQRYD